MAKVGNKITTAAVNSFVLQRELTIKKNSK